MQDYTGYIKVSHGELPIKKLQSAIKNGKLLLTANELKGNKYTTLFHPMNAKIITGAKTKGKGCVIHLAGGEIASDIEYHDMAGSGLEGGSLWSWIKNKAVPWVKKNWSVIKPIVSKIADVAIPAAATALGATSAGPVVRDLVQKTTGVGVGGSFRAKGLKGTQEMKDKMAKLRAMRKPRSSGSSQSDGSTTKNTTKSKKISIMDDFDGGSFLSK